MSSSSPAESAGLDAPPPAVSGVVLASVTVVAPALSVPEAGLKYSSTTDDMLPAGPSLPGFGTHGAPLVASAIAGRSGEDGSTNAICTIATAAAAHRRSNLARAQKRVPAEPDGRVLTWR